MSNDFNCKQLEPLLSAYHDDELTEAERADAERHLNGCVECQNRLLEISAVANSLKSLPRLNPRTDVAATIEHLIANQPKKVNQVQRPIIWGAAGIAAAAAVLLVSTNFKAVTKGANDPLTANSTTKQIMPVNPDRSAAKSQDLEIAHTLEPTSNPAREVTEPAQSSTSGSQRGEEAGTASTKDGVVPTQNEKPSTERNSKKNSKFNPRLEVASKGGEDADKIVAAKNVVAKNVVTASASSTDSSAPQLIANHNIRTSTISPDSNLVAIYDTEQRGVTEELGITTDEDGLYAIKL